MDFEENDIEQAQPHEAPVPTIRVGITQGDINGIGLEVVLKTLANSEVTESFIPVLYAQPKAVAFHKKTIEELPNINFNNINSADEVHPRRVNLVACGDDNTHVEFGVPTEYAGQAAFSALKTAVADLKDGKIDVLVTAPINKKNIQGQEFNFPGHTEYLQAQAGGIQPLMLLCAGKLRVGVVAGHLPISQVPAYITEERILEKLRILNATLKKDFTIRRPRIAVLGLNPHAGDNGLLGTEEQDVIMPAIKKAGEEGIYAMGPYAADGVFGSEAVDKFDAVLAMYHDQGLAPFKALAFDSGVNFTAGLPFIRTSPDHGTAYDIAGKNMAQPDSFRAALWMAIDVFKNRKQNAELSANPLVTRAEQKVEKNA